MILQAIQITKGRVSTARGFGIRSPALLGCFVSVGEALAVLLGLEGTVDDESREVEFITAGVVIIDDLVEDVKFAGTVEITSELGGAMPEGSVGLMIVKSWPQFPESPSTA